MSASSFRCVLMGEQSLLIRCGDRLRARGHQIVGVVADDAHVAAWARTHDLPRWSPTVDYAAALADVSFAYFFSVANLRIVPPSVLAQADRDAINFHDGPLPEQAGMYVPAWSLLERHTEHGVTWHRMTADVDEGDILVRRPVSIAPSDTTFTLNTKCYEAGAASFEDLLTALETDSLRPTPQDLSRQTYYPWDRRPAHAAVLDWTQDAVALDALVRALHFGVSTNPFAVARMLVDEDIVLVDALTPLATQSGDAPGTVVDVTDDRLVVATGTHDIALTALRTPEGAALTPNALSATYGVARGTRLPLLDADTARRLDTMQETLVRHESYWRGQLRRMTRLDLPYVTPTDASTDLQRAEQAAPSFSLNDTDPATATAAAWAGYLARLTQADTFTLGLHADAADLPDGLPALCANRVPWTVSIERAAPAATAVRALADSLATAEARAPYLRDLVARTPSLSTSGGRLPATVDLILDAQPVETLPAGVALALQVHPDGALTWLYDAAQVSGDAVAQMQDQFARFVESLAAAPEQPLQAVSLLDASTLETILHDWNDTARPYDATPIHQQFAAQASRTPDAPALTVGDETWTYQTLDRRARTWARYLRDQGVRPGDRVGVCAPRSLDMGAVLLGVWMTGAAYVPLDPDYPADRIAFMIRDAGLAALVSQRSLAPLLDGTDVPTLFLDASDQGSPLAPDELADDADAMAYVLYTSGSTGTPKGVMVTHRNVANFFAGMDDRLPSTSDGTETWLSVTSISFDISVLELFWTLTRGHHVVLHVPNGAGRRPATSQGTSPAPTGPDPSSDGPRFSLFYFSSDETLDGGGTAQDKYRLLLAGAEYGDAHGYDAVWTPERHFHDFGGLYPNPSVISAAIAARTDRIGIRAGSCVSPLHHPVRIAEDWAVVDNLSGGRVGISFAAGWQPNDFVLQPQNFADRKVLMFEQIEQVRALWRGEARSFDGPAGTPVSVRTLPRPVQPELPVWVTAAGNPETFEQAGAGGYHLLTHLLGQSVEELADKIAAYRRAWREAGHAGQGTVTLMLHTFVGDDPEAVRSTVRAPMKAYLRSSIGLIRDAAWSFPTFKERTTTDAGTFSLDGLTDDETEAVLDHAFARYYETSGLFGTPEQCLARVREVTAVGVDEIACLLDFGVDAQTVLDHLPFLTDVKDQAQVPARTVAALATSLPAGDASIPVQIRRHGVTHLQCTPSQARLLVADAETRRALGTLRAMMVGGEAFPPALARELSGLVAGPVLNMYGPTETTIWSSTWTVADVDGAVPIGTPIANTTMYVLDAARQPVPPGLPGELWIGGDGVTAGYLHREVLTAERFADNPFHDGRMYRTGDRVRHAPDGTLHFLGRTDFQVKLRGHRIELGEIEAVLERQPGVQAAVAHVHTTDDDQRLVAYVQPVAGTPLDPEAIRTALAAALPAIMVPGTIVPVAALPLTPNGKVDRSALPAPTSRPAAAATPTAPAEEPSVPPTGTTEAIVADTWQTVLGLDAVAPTDNFFDLGGHSLLVVQVVRRLTDRLGRGVSIVELFQHPTVRGLAAHLDAADPASTGADRGLGRAERRRQMLRRPV